MMQFSKRSIQAFKGQFKPLKGKKYQYESQKLQIISQANVVFAMEVFALFRGFKL